MMVSAAEHGQLSEDEIGSAEKVVAPAKASIEKAQSKIDNRMRGADGAMKDELAQMLDKVKGIRKSLDTVVMTIRRQRESLSVQGMLKKAAQKVDAAAQASTRRAEVMVWVGTSQP